VQGIFLAATDVWFCNKVGLFRRRTLCGLLLRKHPKNIVFGMLFVVFPGVAETGSRPRDHHILVRDTTSLNKLGYPFG
jgi:hypothetical protein